MNASGAKKIAPEAYCTRRYKSYLEKCINQIYGIQIWFIFVSIKKMPTSFTANWHSVNLKF